ncbi:MAG: hypothetical protein PHW96_03820 [Candidatus Nanoarchaeia archaeon]|nr:hypothetical protein [Candidatus Nanoarchaeia archaeon]
MADFNEYLKTEKKGNEKWKDILLYGTIAGGVAVTVLVILFVLTPYINRIPTAREVLSSGYSKFLNSRNIEVAYEIQFLSNIDGVQTNAEGSAKYMKTGSAGVFSEFNLETGVIDENQNFIARGMFSDIMPQILSMSELPLEENTGTLSPLRQCNAIRFWIPATQLPNYDLYFEDLKASDTVTIFLCLDSQTGVPLMAFYSVRSGESNTVALTYTAMEFMQN